jgi:crotonobetainyl-CoA hydratase|tara:strand:+ start:19383 stop:20156 length:774 start_codon:yes stop_codon:yes gene_type:complete
MTGFHTSRSGEMLEIVIDNPKANAIDAATSQALGKVFAAFNTDPALRVAIITGAGDRFFCAGGDVAELDRAQGNVDYGPQGFAGLTHFPALSKPVIAAVNGICAGGGLELALACDMIVASAGARFCLTETQIGTLPFLVTVQRLLRRMPVNIATEMLYTGRRMSAAEMQGTGLINHVVPHEDLRQHALYLAECVAASAPRSIATVRRAITLIAGSDPIDAAALEALESDFASVMASDDANEGAAAFVEKRKPQWQGR